MGRYEHLPIYKQSFNLLVELHKLVPTFPKKYKFSLGSSIIEDLTQSIVLIIQINSTVDNKSLFVNLILILETIKIKIRIMKNLGIISTKLYFNLSEKLISLLKQAEGWKKK